jgi:hypothetical protein
MTPRILTDEEYETLKKKLHQAQLRIKIDSIYQDAC